MSPELILNCISSIALVVLKYPAVKKSFSLSDGWYEEALPIKCLTKVVDDGLNKCKYPLPHSSFSAPISPVQSWKPVPCAWSLPAS